MSIYDNQVTNSDLDAFKNAGVVQTTSVNFSGSLGSGQRLTVNAAPLTATSPDFAQILFDNSSKHSGKFKNLVLEQITMILETTNNVELACQIFIKVSGIQVLISASLFNQAAGAVTLQNTTLNFRYIPYEATF